VVIHSYRHRFGYAPGDPALEDLETKIAKQPVIRVPTISLCGAEDGVHPPSAGDADLPKFGERYERRVLAGVGHDIPREAPDATTRALLDLLRS
jgi:pimeloyl-ACP methyl ester carboxylesterase